VKAWKVICATLVIFCAGFVAGGLVVRELTAPAAPPPATWTGQTRLQTLLRRMDRELALTPEQHDQVEKIISTSQEKMREVSRPVSTEIRAATMATTMILTAGSSTTATMILTRAAQPIPSPTASDRWGAGLRPGANAQAVFISTLRQQGD
jgi:hypothetical protein